MDNPPQGDSRLVSFPKVNDDVQILKQRARRLDPSSFLRPDILRDRHSESEMAQIVPANQFMEADLFLFLRSIADITQPNSNWMEKWWPWSAICSNQVPRFLLEAAGSKDVSSQIREALRIQSADLFKEVVSIARDRLRDLKNEIGFTSSDGPLSYFDLQSLVKP